MSSEAAAIVGIAFLVRGRKQPTDEGNVPVSFLLSWLKTV